MEQVWILVSHSLAFIIGIVFCWVCVKLRRDVGLSSIETHLSTMLKDGQGVAEVMQAGNLLIKEVKYIIDLWEQSELSNWKLLDSNRIENVLAAGIDSVIKPKGITTARVIEDLEGYVNDKREVLKKLKAFCYLQNVSDKDMLKAVSLLEDYVDESEKEGVHELSGLLLSETDAIMMKEKAGEVIKEFEKFVLAVDDMIGAAKFDLT